MASKKVQITREGTSIKIPAIKSRIPIPKTEGKYKCFRGS